MANVNGFDVFREHFAGFEDSYVIIGGVACDLNMDAAGVEFRTTKDIDLVLLAENLGEGFVAHFWRFVKEGGYEIGSRKDGKSQYYRFQKPTNPQFPAMLELFSRRPTDFPFPPDSQIIPVHVDDEVSSLSAILLEDEYYEFIVAGRKNISGVSTLGPERLIPLKVSAWLDLSEKKSRGESVDSKNIKKHKNDVFRLYELLVPSDNPHLSSTIAADMKKFVDFMRANPSEKLHGASEDALDVIEIFFRLKGPTAPVPFPPNVP